MTTFHSHTGGRPMTTDLLTDAERQAMERCNFLDLPPTNHDVGELPVEALQDLWTLAAALVRLAPAMESAAQSFNTVLDAVRRSLMEHGDCKSGKRYGGVPKACTACMAKRELEEHNRRWKGWPIRLKALVAALPKG